MVVKHLPTGTLPQRVFGALQAPKNAETEEPTTHRALNGDKDVADWLAQMKNIAVLRMLVILYWRPYNGPGSNGEEDCLNTDMLPREGDPTYITGDMLSKAVAQIR